MNRTCFVCGQADDHPMHHSVLPDGSSAYAHMDCHARQDPPCGPCKAVTDSHGGTLTGNELRQHIVANDPAGKWIADQQQEVVNGG